MKETIVIFDLETTGLDLYYDEILEFGAWRIEEGKKPVSLQFLVCPRQEVTNRVLKLTGIIREELACAGTLEEHREEIFNFFQDAVLVGHNIEFDLRFLQRGLRCDFNQEYWDTLELARIFFPALGHYRLSVLAEKLDLALPDDFSFHRALTDAWITWKLLEACWHKGKEYDLSFYDQAKRLLEGWKGAKFLALLHQEITRSFPERLIYTDVVTRPGEEGLFVENVFQDEVPTEAEWVLRSFSSGGILQEILSGYESRLGQIRMAESVVEGLTNSQHIVVEAGTGTGKSFAYLLPALWWARKTGQKVVVATHTIPLQEQLYQKDLPVLAQILPFSFRSVILKGKGNYCCLKKWAGTQANPSELSTQDRLAALSVLSWLRETETGDLQELPQTDIIQKIRFKISAETENCDHQRCPRAGICFLFRARKRAENADLVIVNHSLLFSDLKTDYKVLPEYRYLVVDEAHHLHSSALEQLGSEMSLDKVERLLEKVYRPQGQCFYLSFKLRQGYYAALVTSAAWDVFTQKLEEIPKECEAVLEQVRELFLFFAKILNKQQTLRLIKAFKQENWWSALAIQAENLMGRLSQLVFSLEGLNKVLAAEDTDELDSLRRELAGYQRDLEGFKETLSFLLNIEDIMRVTWLEYKSVICLKSSFVDVSQILNDKVFSRLNSAILTSATLSIAGSFRHYLQEVGLPKSTLALQVASPFDFGEQMSLYVVKDLWKSQEAEGIIAAKIAEFVAEIAQHLRGRTLVLFTSHRLLQAAYIPLLRHLEKSDLNLLAQGIDGGRSTILGEFLRNPGSVLLGATSFWEGIDIPGQALSCVILVKLPFWPPSLPLIEARSELLQSQGRNPFWEFMLPEAVIKFKQGFGRLIRSKTDRGFVILLDDRVISKRYGSMFLSSLPLETHRRGDGKQVLEKIETWIENETAGGALF
ncbi:MAG TPA: helicase C-terminal domain-containing protein [Desulfitobacteriaceae bacterium]|nr:helicase C-terminal domain-containing protein [Desulfitobacteriaceae bacterium]